MFSENSKAVDGSDAGIGRATGLSESACATGVYHVQCFDRDGNLKWTDEIKNVVTTVGKNDALDKHLSGSGYTAAWYLGLISATGYVSVPVAADTAASHATWAEDQNYSQGTRPAASFASASAGAKALASAAEFTMNANSTLKGCFLISVSTKGGTTGILYSAGLFSGGDKIMQSGDTLNTSYQAAL